jgi:hypothetical protein
MSAASQTFFNHFANQGARQIYMITYMPGYTISLVFDHDQNTGKYIVRTDDKATLRAYATTLIDQHIWCETWKTPRGVMTLSVMSDADLEAIKPQPPKKIGWCLWFWGNLLELCEHKS